RHRFGPRWTAGDHDALLQRRARARIAPEGVGPHPMKRQRAIPVSRRRLESLAWKITPRDYRAKWEGARSVLVLGPTGTTLKPLADFSAAELIRYLGRHYVA